MSYIDNPFIVGLGRNIEIFPADQFRERFRQFRTTRLTWNNRKTRRFFFFSFLIEAFVTAAVVNVSFLKVFTILKYLHERHCLLREIFKINWNAATSGK